MPAHHVASGRLVADGATVASSGKPHQLLDRARKLHAGVRALSPLGAEEAYAAIFLASWCIELALKSYLELKGQGKKQLQPIQHDLAALWARAATCGLPVSLTPPQWCEKLGETHKGPGFHLRYPTDAAAMVSPNASLLERELAALLALIGEQVR